MVSGHVSKLYNTLEKIRTGEQGGATKKKSTPVRGFGLNADTSGKRRIILLGASALLGIALIMFIAGQKPKDTKPPITPAAAAPGRIPVDRPTEPTVQASTSAKVSPAPPASLAASPAGTGKDLYRQLNDTGVALIQKNQPWQGIYYLEQARKQQPERPEALINMAVALAELGLRAPAKRLFSEAHALAPNHPLLRKNLDLLGQADFFDDQWVSSLFAGPPLPGQTK